MSKFRLQIPASSANIGPGFDSAGIALNRYLTIEAQSSDSWVINQLSSLLPATADYRDNFIYQIAEKTAKQFNCSLPACKLTVDSEIPLARGLGSSSTAVVAGIELANQLCNLQLEKEAILRIGTEIEGHPDNIAPTLFGGLVIAAMPGENVEYIQLPVFSKVDIIVYIPSVELKTETARGILPDNLTRGQAANASSISNVMIAALLSDDFSLAGKMMELDLFHEPYRAELIPFYHQIRQEAKQCGAYGTVISGAGPTMLSFVPKGNGKKTASRMQQVLPNHQVDALEIDTNGLQISHY